MSASAVVIAVLSGGFVGVVYKSAQERTAWFRAQMIDAAQTFMTSVSEAEDALDDVFRHLARFADAQQEKNKAVEALTAPLEEEDEEDEDETKGDHSSEITLDVRPFARALREINTHLFSDRVDARDRIDREFENLAHLVNGLREANTPRVVVRRTEDLLGALKRWIGVASEGRQRAAAVRNGINRAVRARARLSLLFAGRSGGESVLSAASDVLNHLDRLRDIATAAADEDAHSVDSPEMSEEWAALRDAVEEFAGSTNRAVRKSIL